MRVLGDPVLSTRCEELRIEHGGVALTEARRIADEMTTVLRETPGVAVAANQIGLPVRVVVIEDETVKHEEALEDKRLVRVPHTVMVDPVIVGRSPTLVLHVEGCLSVPGYFALVERPEWVDVTWHDLGGESRSDRFDGWPARIVCHELDHLDGLSIVDRMSPRGMVEIETYKRLWRGVPPVKVREALAGVEGAEQVGGLGTDAN
jgi:peptide deformylase